MEFQKSEPTLVKTIGILQLVLGILGLICGLAALAGAGKAFNQGGGNSGIPGLTQAEIEQMVEAEIPHQHLATALETGFGFVLSVLMVGSGVGLMNKQAWGRQVALCYAVLSIAYHVIDILYGIIFVVPGMSNVADKIAAKAGPNGGVVGGAMKVTMIVGLIIAALITIYPIVILLVMQRSGVKAALAGGEGESFDMPKDYDDRHDRGGADRDEPDDRYRQPPDDRFGPQ